MSELRDYMKEKHEAREYSCKCGYKPKTKEWHHCPKCGKLSYYNATYFSADNRAREYFGITSPGGEM